MHRPLITGKTAGVLTYVSAELSSKMAILIVPHNIIHEFRVSRLATLMAKNKHRTIDLLKMDIEGFEYSVLDDMISSGIYPVCLLLEFHHFQRKDPDATLRSVKMLKDAGYALFWISDLGAEYGFYRLVDRQSS